jgi:EAL domain-containing protein (putative c-di-GMP-specific phosphodiesterase class I)
MSVSNIGNFSTSFPKPFQSLSCRECREGKGLDFSISMAFQPIYDWDSRSIMSQEALVRGGNGEPASWVFEKINTTNKYAFDQACRVKAIQVASQLEVQTKLNINFLPNAVYRPETCIAATLEATKEFCFPVSQIVFEVTESEEVLDKTHLLNIFESYKKQGFSTAIDDFGAGYSGLNLLSMFQPDYLKLDMELIRDIDQSDPKYFIVDSIVTLSEKLGIQVIAEGIETEKELAQLRKIGVRFFQGYFFAKPSFESVTREIQHPEIIV